MSSSLPSTREDGSSDYARALLVLKEQHRQDISEWASDPIMVEVATSLHDDNPFQLDVITTLGFNV